MTGAGGRGPGKEGLPPRTLAGILGVVVLLMVGMKLANRKAPPPTAPAAVPDTQPQAPDAGAFDPELYRVPLGFLEEALYGTGGVGRIAEASRSLARAVMVKNITNPMERNIVIELQTRLDHLAQLDGSRAEAAREWEAIRREYFKPAAWLHAPAAPAPR